MASFFVDSGASAVALDIVARQLAALGERIHDELSTARALADATDWRSRSAITFHERASEWAESVARLPLLADAARTATIEARDRAAARHAWESVVERASGGAP